MDTKKPIEEMTDQELVDSWEAGCKWTTSKMDSNDPETHQLFLAGLKRIEALEDELKKRKVNYGRG